MVDKKLCSINSNVVPHKRHPFFFGGKKLELYRSCINCLESELMQMKDRSSLKAFSSFKGEETVRV